MAFALVLSLIAGPALGGWSGERIPPMASPWSGDGAAQSRLVLAEPSHAGGGPVWAGVEIKVAPGWVTYWRTPGQGGMPPRFEWGGSENLAMTAVRWPAPERTVIGGHSINVYTGRVVLPIRLFPAMPDRDVRVRLKLAYAVCMDVCKPVTAEHELTILARPVAMVDGAGYWPLIRQFLERVPTDDVSALGLSVSSVVLNHAGGSLKIEVRSHGPLIAPDIFVEGPTSTVFGEAFRSLSQEGDTAWFLVPIERRGRHELEGESVTITVIDGDRRIEQRQVVDPAP